MNRSIPKCGEVFRHFKGNLYKVIEVENRKQTDKDTFDYCNEYLLINGRCLK